MTPYHRVRQTIQDAGWGVTWTADWVSLTRGTLVVILGRYSGRWTFTAAGVCVEEGSVAVVDDFRMLRDVFERVTSSLARADAGRVGADLPGFVISGRGR